jgi:hypothetical protein
MSREHFDVRRIRDGVTYNTKASELLAYAEGRADGPSNSRWRAGLFRTSSGAYFAVREDMRHYFDQINGHWADNTSVTLEVLDHASSVKWCEQHDANLLVDFVEQSVEEPERLAEAAPEGVLLSLSDTQKSDLALEAETAGMSVEAYLLHCVESKRAAQEAPAGAVEAGCVETGAVASSALAEASCESPVQPIVVAASVEEVVAATVEAESEAAKSEELSDDQLSSIEVLPMARQDHEPVVLTIAQENEDGDGWEDSTEAEIVLLTPEVIHQNGADQNSALHNRSVVAPVELGQAAE